MQDDFFSEEWAQLGNILKIKKFFLVGGGTIRCKYINDFQWFLMLILKNTKIFFGGGAQLDAFSWNSKIFFEEGGTKVITLIK